MSYQEKVSPTRWASTPGEYQDVDFTNRSLHGRAAKRAIEKADRAHAAELKTWMDMNEGVDHRDMFKDMAKGLAALGVSK